MSSYLTIYLVPKKTKETYSNGVKTEIKISEGIPLVFKSYSCSTDIYQAFDEMLSVYKMGEYIDLTLEKSTQLIQEQEDSIKKTKERLDINYKILKEGGYNEDIAQDIHMAEDYLKEQNATLMELRDFDTVVTEINHGFTDFEKVQIMID